LALLDLLEPRLRTLLGAPIVMGERAWNRAPEQVRRGRDDVMCGELVGGRDNVGIDAVNRASKHDGRTLGAGVADVEVRREAAALARADPDPLRWHRLPPAHCSRTAF